MSTPIPMPLRAAAGLAAVAIDAARKLPSQLVGLPVLAVSTTLQASLKAQQRYAELVARGDQLLGQLRPPTDGTPAWARFDDEPADSPIAGSAMGAAGAGSVTGAAGRPPSAFDSAPEPVAAGPLDEEAADVLGAAEEAADLADAELAEPEFADAAVADPAFADAAVADPEFADTAVADPEFADAAVADPEFADTAVADPEFADTAVADPEFADGAVADPARADSYVPGPAFGGPPTARSAAADLAEPRDSELADTWLADGVPDAFDLADEERAETDLANAGLADAVPDASDLADEEPADEERAESELADAGAVAGVEARPGPADPLAAQDRGRTDAELSAAAVADATLTAAARTEPAEPADFGADAEAVADALSEAADGPPVPRYDELSIPQLRGHLRTLDETTLEQLVAYERAHADRAPYVTMLENRLATLRSR